MQPQKHETLKNAYDALLAELALFPDRETNLRNVTRYSLYKIMWYRTNLWTHSRRVAWITERLSPAAEEVFGADYDAKRAIALALVHDDAETVFGDIQAGNKLKMTKEELHHVEELERNAIETLAAHSPKYIGGYEYKTLLLDALEKYSLEALVVNWADKIDGFCEALHEVYAGNAFFTVNVTSEYGLIPLPTDYYIEYFKGFQRKYPKAASLFQKDSPLFAIPQYPDVQKIVQGRHPHTARSITQKTEYPLYDFWIGLTEEMGTSDDIAHLYVQVI